MGTHPIFESDFDCLTEMYLSRFAREADDSEYSWYPPKGQWGTAWLPEPGASDEKLNLQKVNILFILFAIQTAWAAFGILSSWCNKDESANAKSKAGGSSTSGTGLFVGILGLLAILYDCRQCLMATLILNFIAVILAAILLVFILIGMIAALKDVGDGGCCAMIFGAVCTLIIFGCAMVFQVAMIILSFPFIQADVEAIQSAVGGE